MILFFRQILAVIRKDVSVELRSPVRVIGVLFFAVILVVMIAFAAGSTTSLLQQLAGGALWIGLLLTSTRALDQSFAIEHEQGAFEEMLLWPVEPAAIFLGKAIANTLVLLLVALILTPVIIALFDAEVRGSVPMLLGFLVLGCTALAAPGTMYKSITVRARGSSVLLPLLLFPLVVPALMAAARGTTVVMEGDPQGQAPAWLAVLVIFNLIHWSMSTVLFGYVTEST